MENTKANPLGTLDINVLIRKFALPSIMAMMVGAIYNIVDQFFIGRSVGELGNAATNVAFPLSICCIAIALLLGIGGAAAFNISLGEGDREKAVYYLGNASVLLFTFGLILCITVLVFLTPLMFFFGAPDNVLGYAKTYTSITAIGFPFLIFSTGSGHLIRADGSPRYTLLFNLTGAIINTILDPVFIFGFGMGMAGAALATVIGQICAALLAFRYLRHCKTVRIQKKNLIPKWQYTKRIMALGTASCFNQIAMMIVQIVLNKSLTFYGALSPYGEAIPLAAVGIITKVNQLFFAIVIGISQGMQPIASFNYGARNFDRVKKVYYTSLCYGLAVSAFAFMLFQIFPRQIISVFGSGSEEYYSFAILYFRIYLFFTFINCIQPMSATFFTAIGKPRKGIFLSLTRQILFLLPLIIILPLFLGINGIMFAGPVADFVAALVSVIMICIEMRNLI
ncbi:MATE family efflux transporter [Acetivibrio clariflavus]|uniref:Multidrug export protein MepA n=1 Tax=Acetivibrio clariflavus (strain DSM 19732 / NBRC 101661 / EBR45) TaxID=720554 RepID=G8LWM4_ACECE|nr:MATE family efflux transporter [Acetivibrio clariflavus]AEV68692.1 putative efflux protein, MATE family [Acetivibrio clariflavus DSM 19732]